MSAIIRKLNTKLNGMAASLSGIPLLLTRLYLAPVMAQAGWQKLANFDSTVDWFGNQDYGLGLPLPFVLAGLAALSEFIGAVFLVLGLATRLTAIPLMIIMVVAMITVHWQNGWPAIADAGSWLADGTLLMNESVMAAPEKLSAAKAILNEHGYIDWLTSSGNFVILNNGIEFAVTYFIMLTVLFCFGGGRYVSVDYYLARHFNRQ